MFKLPSNRSNRLKVALARINYIKSLPKGSSKDIPAWGQQVSWTNAWSWNRMTSFNDVENAVKTVNMTFMQLLHQHVLVEAGLEARLHVVERGYLMLLADTDP